MTTAELRTPAGWRQHARAFADNEVAPAAEAIDRAGKIPPEIPAGLGREGFTGLGIPLEFGGLQGNTEITAAVLEEIARGDAAVATLLSVHLSVAAAPIVRWGTPGQKAHYLPRMASGEWLGAFALTEPGVGSDAARLTCRYRANGNSFVLNGTKTFITDAATARVLVLFATRDPGEGHRGISAFLVPSDSPGFAVTRRLDKLGIRGSETGELVLTDVTLPKAALLGNEGEGLPIALGTLTGGRVGIASCALGVARAAFEEMQRAVRADPTDWKRLQLARSYAQVEAAAALVLEAARLKDSGREFAEAASAAKLSASQAAVETAQRTLDIVGPVGVRSGHRAERLFRDARVFPIVEGTTEVQELILGRSLG